MSALRDNLMLGGLGLDLSITVQSPGTNEGGLPITPNNSKTRVNMGWTDAAGLSGAVIGPPLLVVLVHVVFGEGYGFLARVEQVAVLGPVLSSIYHVVVGLYFPSFLVNGSVGPVFTLFALYPILGLVLLLRGKWVRAVIVLVLPLMCTWILSASLLGD